LLRERELLAKVNGAITVAGLCERFLVDAEEHLEPATYTSYQYACQKLVDALGARLAHSIQPDDIASFSPYAAGHGGAVDRRGRHLSE
jgi:hypothetical protein